MDLAYLSKYAFFFRPKSLELGEEALQELIVLPGGLGKLDGDFALKQTQFLYGSDALHAVVLLELSLHLLMVLEGEEVFQQSRVLQLIILQHVIQEVAEILLLPCDVLGTSF
jgi:hypothetical protein